MQYFSLRSLPRSVQKLEAVNGITAYYIHQSSAPHRGALETKLSSNGVLATLSVFHVDQSTDADEDKFPA